MYINNTLIKILKRGGIFIVCLLHCRGERVKEVLWKLGTQEQKLNVLGSDSVFHPDQAPM